MNFIQLLNTKFDNESVIKEYVDYIQNNKLANDTVKSDTMYEVHHVLPESLFEEYRYEPTNLVKLTLYDHLVVHYILAKTGNSKMLFAFNMMSRVRHSGILTDEQLDEVAKMYSELRKDISANVSAMRLANPSIMTDAGKAVISKFTKNNVVVTNNITGVSKRVNVNEYYSNPDLYTHHMTGKTHSDETKQKMSDNGIKGKFAFTHKETGKVIYEDESFSDTDYVKGNPTYSETASKRFKGDSHWTNIITGESFRAKECPGENWIKKRSNFSNPFEGKALLVDIKTGNKELIAPEDVTPQYCIHNKILLVSSTHIISTKEAICNIINVEQNSKNANNAFNYIKGKKVPVKFKTEANLTLLNRFKIVKASELNYQGQIIL